jgi:hypothetical protein
MPAAARRARREPRRLNRHRAAGLLASAGGVRSEDAMLTQQSCSWCHALNAVTDHACAACGHRADLPRMACDCRRCCPPAGLPLRLGRLLATPGALARLVEAGVPPAALLARHASGDWGDVDADDQAANDRAIRDGDRVLSAYETCAGRVWLISEWDRSATTLLLPEEY